MQEVLESCSYPDLVRRLAFCLALTFLAGFSLAQPTAQSAPVSGLQRLAVTVTDENGVAVPSARVLLQTSPPAIPRRCETDFAGRCQFAGLSPGTYQVRVEKEGSYALLLPTVQIGITANLDVTLSHQREVREVVDVVESPPAIDPAQITSQEKLRGLDVINIPYPATRDYRNALNFIPGVVQDNFGQPHVAGAETYQTLTLLDGFNVTQPANGLLLVRVSTDAFRSIDVEPSREPAEYGKGSGGVLSLNTGIGDDHYRFAATNFIPSLQNKKGWRFDQVDPRITFSGPLRKRKMWFYDAADGEYDEFVFTELPNGGDIDPLWRVGNLAKVQTNLSSRNILTTSFLINHLNDEHSGLSPLNPAQATPTDAESAYVGTVKDQHYFAGGELLETGFGFDQYNLGLMPLGTAAYFVSPEATGGNYYLNAQTRARRWQALSNLYLPPHEWHGRHEIKLGVDLDRLDYEAQFARQPISFLREGPKLPPPSDTCLTGPTATPPPCSRYSTFSGGADTTTYNFETSAYAEDRWLVTNRLLIEPGVRLDWDEIVRSVLFSPRLAGTYVLDREGNTKLSAGIGIVYDATSLFLVARPFAGQRTDYFFDSSGNPTDANGNPTSAPTPVFTAFSVNKNALKAPRFVNWSLGLEKKLPAAIYLKAEFMQKRGTRGFVYNTLSGASGGNFETFALQNTRDDRYDAFQLSLRRSFSKSYMIMGSYTRSRSRSNEVLDFNVDNPILSPQAAGPYPWDAPNRFLSWGLLPFVKLPVIKSVDVAYSMEARTGFPFDVVNDQQQLVEAPGSRRFPTYYSLNLQLEKRFRLFGFYWALRGGFNNITDHKNPFVVNNDASSTQFLTFSAFNRRAFTSRIRFLGRK
ncbi:MAG: hypothetical protein AUH86_09320 [Acidobacteria bacterium 13_1_40CM_4_58_4]|nr:MAG: hypothetical protein AUH86_09320 [Acidobacteria bacterium 13_1_40CM_4_58_4]